MKIWLLDTGPLVAYLDRSDPDHTTVAAALETCNRTPRGKAFDLVLDD